MYKKFYSVRSFFISLLLAGAIGSANAQQQIAGDSTCGTVVYQVTSAVPTGSGSIYPFQYIKTLNITNGTAGTTWYNGRVGLCFKSDGTPLPNGSLLKNTSAIAFDGHTMRLYFVNNSTTTAEDLCYIDLSNTSSVAAYKFDSSPLETTIGTGYNITRMAFASDGYGYALTENGNDLIQFSADSANMPHINRLGALVNDSSNGTHDVLAETDGDICSDGSAGLYFIPNSCNVYRINPATKVATWLGTISGTPAKLVSSVAMDAGGNLYIGGAYQTVYMASIATMTATPISSGTTNVWRSGDYASCALPASAARLSTVVKSNNNAAADIKIAVQPNPFVKELNVQVQLNTGGPVRVRLIDFYGRTVFTTSQTLGAGSNSLHLDVPAGLSSGIYVLELWSGNNRLLQKKLLKQ